MNELEGKKGKIIVLSAPSGTGKSTIVSQLMKMPELKLKFSVSATSRKPRGQEQHGKEYYFLTNEEFKQRIASDEFVEWEEVYEGTCYGTLVSEVERVIGQGNNLIMDIDVAGALNVKKRYGKEVCTLFILPPSREVLEERLRNRGTEDEASIQKRLGKAEHELGFTSQFDHKVVNDNLGEAVKEVRDIIYDFVN